MVRVRALLDGGGECVCRSAGVNSRTSVRLERRPSATRASPARILHDGLEWRRAVGRAHLPASRSALVESGPIGGCIGAGVYAEALGIAKSIAFDMGGTTAKCAVVEDGRFSR
jgi:hypothetical protein